MTNLINFDYENNQVRTFEIEGDAWFTAKDVAEILGYARTNKMLEIVDNDDKKTMNPQNLDDPYLVQSFGDGVFNDVAN